MLSLQPAGRRLPAFLAHGVIWQSIQSPFREGVVDPRRRVIGGTSHVVRYTTRQAGTLQKQRGDSASKITAIKEASHMLSSPECVRDGSAGGRTRLSHDVL